ncbi:hypothetical protein FQN49_007929 [Arthroderma sp. PD_2]|nr:hypothetical protein FQN49_007929 [Arthroderma sp. PD_2]
MNTVVSSRGEKYLPKGHHLSGIGYLPGARTMEGKYILAPRDPNVACIGGMRENSEALKVCPVPHIFSYLTQCENNLEGLIIHSRCWDMIEHQIGSLAVTRLDLVAEALQRYWQRTLQSLRNDSSLKHESPYDLCYTFNLWHNSRDEYYGSGGFGSPKPPVGDPMFVPEVSALLQEQPQFSFRQQAAKGNALCLLTRRYALPLEIKYLIAGHLGIEDVCNMLLAFGEEFPVNYWRQQAHGDIIFELDSVDPDRLPFLAREIIKRGLLQEVEGLQFRQRLIETLVPIKQDILEMSASDYGDGGKGTGFGG